MKNNCKRRHWKHYMLVALALALASVLVLAYRNCQRRAVLNDSNTSPLAHPHTPTTTTTSNHNNNHNCNNNNNNNSRSRCSAQNLCFHPPPQLHPFPFLYMKPPYACYNNNNSTINNIRNFLIIVPTPFKPSPPDLLWICIAYTVEAQQLHLMHHIIPKQQI